MILPAFKYKGFVCDSIELKRFLWFEEGVSWEWNIYVLINLSFQNLEQEKSCTYGPYSLVKFTKTPLQILDEAHAV